MKQEIKNGQMIVKIEDGINLKEKKVKRGYLRADEMNNFIMCYTIAQLIEGKRSAQRKEVPPMWEVWENSGIITKEQKKNLKTAHTFLTKFVNDVFANNLDVKTKDNVVKKNMKWEFKLIDDYTVQKLYKMLSNMSEVNMTTQEFYDLVDSKMYVECRGCTKNRCECELHSFFEQRLVPPMDEGKECNCEYAY